MTSADTQTLPCSLTRADLARLFNISTKTVDRWTQLGLLPKPAIKRGRTVRWLARDIDNHQAKIATVK